MIAEVIVDILHSNVDRIFEYSFDGDVCPGARVTVPFGNKKIEGIVVNIKDRSDFPIEKIKSIISVYQEVPALTKTALKLSKYISENCYVSWASALRLFLPVEMRKNTVKEQFSKFIQLNEDFILENAINSLKKSAIKQKELLVYLFKNGKTSFTEACKTFGASAVKGANLKGFITLIEEKKVRSPYKQLEGVNKNIVLTEKQLSVCNGIENANLPISLIHGVTGSGKTEVYLELIDRAIKKNQTAIMLVPEISLTPQMLSKLRSRFGDNAAILHSGLSSGERFDEWWRIRNKKAKIVIGARSAIFAPIENLGIIIIDEEHDGSYQSESSPRYQTIDVAEKLAKETGAKLVLGSATPSVDTYKKATEGEYNLFTLPDRINKKPLPDIEVIDMRREIRRGNNTPFSSALKSEIEDCLKEGNQAIIFLNQRGYSKTVICTECGHVFKCQSCDVSLTYHREDDSLLCHYCGAKYKMIERCTECGSSRIRYGGAGTERIVEELSRLFPSAKILRMDRDTTSTKEGHFKILNSFAQKEADILVGTQMIAKGHDFPSVTLVGILDADMSLHFSDFRSSERTFQLITQVAGRAGRAGKAGKVVLQTYSPEHPVLSMAIKYDYLAFYNHEISVRKATGFPPYSDIVRVLIAGISEDKTIEVTKNIYENLSSFYLNNKDKFLFFGCMKAPLKRLQNKFRYQVLIRITAKNKGLINEVYKLSHSFNSEKVSVNLEINPNNLT